MDDVLANHAAVGIRASVCAAGLNDAQRRSASERKWDLCEKVARSADGRTLYQCGLMASEDVEHPLVAADGDGDAMAKGQVLNVLPSVPCPGSVTALMREVEAVVADEKWLIMRLTGDDIDTLSHGEHARLLSWLGDHHSRIWCAPVMDIFQWNKRHA